MWPGLLTARLLILPPGCPGLLRASSLARLCGHPLAGAVMPMKYVQHQSKASPRWKQACWSLGFCFRSPQVLLGDCTGPLGGALPGYSVCCQPAARHLVSLYTGHRSSKIRENASGLSDLASRCPAHRGQYLMPLPKQSDGPLGLPLRVHRRALRLRPFPRMLIKTTTQPIQQHK